MGPVTDMDRRDRAEGVLLGLACGDALGRPVEFNSAERIAAEYGQLTEMIGNGTWNQPAGTITDDTQQALCIARSLVERGAFDPEDIAERFVAWYNSGPFDTGVMTADALREVNRGTPWDTVGCRRPAGLGSESRRQQRGQRKRHAVCTARGRVRRRYE